MPFSWMEIPLASCLYMGGLECRGDECRPLLEPCTLRTSEGLWTVRTEEHGIVNGVLENEAKVFSVMWMK